MGDETASLLIQNPRFNTSADIDLRSSAVIGDKRDRKVFSPSSRLELGSSAWLTLPEDSGAGLRLSEGNAHGQSMNRRFFVFFPRWHLPPGTERVMRSFSGWQKCEGFPGVGSGASEDAHCHLGVNARVPRNGRGGRKVRGRRRNPFFMQIDASISDITKSTPSKK